jgi:hypothetical protein
LDVGGLLALERGLAVQCQRILSVHAKVARPCEALVVDNIVVIRRDGITIKLGDVFVVVEIYRSIIVVEMRSVMVAFVVSAIHQGNGGEDHVELVTDHDVLRGLTDSCGIVAVDERREHLR